MRAATTILVFCVGALLALGMVVLFSAKMLHETAPWRPMTQLAYCCLGLIACTAVATIDYRHLKKLSVPLLGACFVLLCLVFVPHVGKAANGAHRWLKLGGFTLQPSELMKIALVIFLATYCERYARQMHTFKKGVLVPVCVVTPILGLIFIEPDVGTTMLMALVSSILLLIAGLRWRFFLPPVLIGMTAIGLFIYNDPMRSDRIYSWLHLEETKQGKGLQQYQAMVALGSGGITGLGLGNGRQKLAFVPEHHTDFILSVIGEELGLIATMGVVVAFVAIFCCGLFISMRAPDMFGMLVGSGVTFMIGVQAFINMGVVTGLLPNKGMPLPFISYGGSNLLAMLCSVGLLLSISRHATETLRVAKRKNPFEERVADLQEA